MPSRSELADQIAAAFSARRDIAPSVFVWTLALLRTIPQDMRLPHVIAAAERQPKLYIAWDHTSRICDTPDASIMVSPAWAEVNVVVTGPRGRSSWPAEYDSRGISIAPDPGHDLVLDFILSRTKSKKILKG